MCRLSDEWIEPLIGWYDKSKRSLPWREDRAPYHVWISEIMLQQTRIEAVLRYYRRFMDALPDVRSLSEVDDDRLMKLWEGLGYYSRAGNLKKAAQVIVNEHGGVFPRGYAALRKLPGIGDYTAGAIASICFDERVPAVDGNVLRVIARLTGDRRNVLLPQTKKDVTEALQRIIPQRAGAFNEALMELGEVICLPNGAPLCERCPLREHCTAFCDGLCGELPVREKEQKRRSVALSVFILRAPDGRIAVHKRPDTGLLKGMYELPNIEGHCSDGEIRQQLADRGLLVTGLDHGRSAKHVFTHIEWRMKSYRAAVDAPAAGFIWATPEELEGTYPLPTAFRKLLTIEDE